MWFIKGNNFDLQSTVRGNCRGSQREEDKTVVVDNSSLKKRKHKH